MAWFKLKIKCGWSKENGFETFDGGEENTKAANE